MAWIEVHQSLPTHRKTLELADALDVAPVVAVGHLGCLWLWAVDNAPDGKTAGIKPRTVARAAQWEGDPGVFLAALTAAGFLDPDGSIHDWDDYAGKLIERRRIQAEWVRARRQVLPGVLERDGMVCYLCGLPVEWDEISLDHVYPKSRGGTHEASNLRVAHRACNSRKGARI